MYQELAFNEQNPPEWAKHANTETLCPARFEPELRLNSNSHGISDYLTIDQLMVSIQTKDGSFLESPRRCLIECPAWTSRNNLCLRILNAWAKGHPWPIKGTPIALTLFIPLLELKRSFAHFLEKVNYILNTLFLILELPIIVFFTGVPGNSRRFSIQKSKHVGNTREIIFLIFMKLLFEKEKNQIFVH